MSLHSKIEPAAINIERDSTKCLTCHGFFSQKRARTKASQHLPQTLNFNLISKSLQLIDFELQT